MNNFQSLYMSNLTSMQKIAFIATLAWSFLWKGLALWKSAKRNHKYWFMVILIINTLGLLEIAYLIYYQMQDKRSSAKQLKTPKGKK